MAEALIMPTARLFTARGAFVATVEIPPFETGHPPLVMWGERTFMRVTPADALEGRYLEAFCYVATVEVRERGLDACPCCGSTMSAREADEQGACRDCTHGC